MKQLLTSLLLVVVGVAACSDSIGSDEQSPPESGIASIDGGELAPGSRFAVSFSESVDRTMAYSLQHWAEDGWSEPTFILFSDVDGHEPRWETIDSLPIEVEQEGFDGVGPDGLILPDVMPIGIWRLCPVDNETTCVQLVVR